MKKTQTVEQAVARAREVLGESCSVRATDYGKKVTFESPAFLARDAVGEQFTNVKRFDELLNDIKRKIQQLRNSL